MKSNRNVAIDAMRFFFMCILCPFHCPAVNPFPNGYIAVEFFFILAGFFIYQSYRKHSDVGTVDFTWKKIKRFFYPMVLSIIALMLLDRKKYIYLSDYSIDGIVSQYFVHIPELLFCQGLEFIKVNSYINVVLWFVSILIFGGAIIFSFFINCGHKAIAIIIPLMVILGITYLTSFGDCGLVWREQLKGSPLSCDLMRGVLEMGIGVLLSYIYDQKKDSFKNQPLLVNIIGFIGAFGMLLIVLSYNNYDTLALFFVPMLILGCVNAKSWLSRVFKGKVWGWLGELSMYMYFIHSFVSSSYYIVVSKFSILAELPKAGMLIVFLLASLFAGCVLKLLSEHLYQRTFAK